MRGSISIGKRLLRWTRCICRWDLTPWIPHGWQLTPAFDLLPDVNDNREHVLHFGYTGTRPSMAALYELGRNFGLSKQETARVIDEVLAAVEQFPDQCARFGVPEVDLEVLSRHLLSICDR